MPSLVQLNLGRGVAVAALPRGEIPGLYVHIPFCFHKCHYCDFYSITRQDDARMTRFVDLVLREADLWQQLDVRPRTVFFGGGTPSLLPIEQMRRLIRRLRERFDFARLDEFTVEVNPATASLEYCQMLRESGVDRLSFGAQSFDVAELKMLERHHDPDDVPRSVGLARSAGFRRLNVDLIYAIPGQSLESWSRSLERAIELRTPHVSCYGLTYEPNTPMAVKKRLGHFMAAADELELAMMHYARRRLTDAGLPPYEISNYASPGEACRHNLLYWTGGSYAGLGPSAASHVHGTRFKNRPHLGEWERAVEEGDLPTVDVEVLSPQQRAGELVMLQLRLTQGLILADFADQIMLDPRRLYSDVIDRLTRAGLITVDDRAIRLTDRGLDVADAVAAEFVL
jgi:oxygen-independent coproporphyrinogen-3 oxidase